MTVRNNEERLDIPSEPSSIVEEKKVENTLSFVVPTEIVDLPSKGKFYTQGHPLHGKDCVEIRYMTAKEEDILTSKSLLKKGIAIDRMLESLIVDKSIKLDDLLIGDKNALVVASRITGYGPEYDTKITCPSCGAMSRFSFNLNKMKTSEGGETETAKMTDKGTFKVTLPMMKLEVEMKLLKGSDEAVMSRRMEYNKTNKLPENNVTEQFRMFIVSVNGNSSQDVLKRLIETMPAGDAKFLRREYAKIAPSIDLTQSFVCEKCDVESEVDVPFTADFFWSR